MTNISFPERTITSQPKAGESSPSPRPRTSPQPSSSPPERSAPLPPRLMSTRHSTPARHLWHRRHPAPARPQHLRRVHRGAATSGPQGAARSALGGPHALTTRPARTRSTNPSGKPCPRPMASPKLPRLGVADLGPCHSHRHAARASGELALHVLDIMHATLESSRSGPPPDDRKHRSPARPPCPPTNHFPDTQLNPDRMGQTTRAVHSGPPSCFSGGQRRGRSSDRLATGIVARSSSSTAVTANAFTGIPVPSSTSPGHRERLHQRAARRRFLARRPTLGATG
jgi:hypothetical protein